MRGHRRIALVVGILALCALAAFGQATVRRESAWDTSFGTVKLVQEGPLVWGSYEEYHGGRMIGALRDGKLYGFWWEDDDTVGVGPDGKWCGPFVLVFDVTGSSFRGNYGKHSRGESTFTTMDPSRRWDGTKKSGSFEPFEK
jgi:hypothetical protein